MKTRRYEDAPLCSREKPHGGPCNGFYAPACTPGTADEAEILELREAEALAAITSPESKDGNPKDGIGVQKLPLSLVPPITVAYGSLAHLNGALKYGKWNWRKTGVRASVYIDALKRHISKWESGEELDEDGVPHLSSIIADTGIILDSRACGKLQDDRPPRVDTTGLFDRLTPIVKQLLERHKDKAPKHYTIDDSEQSS
jgi:hypothetical protein